MSSVQVIRWGRVVALAIGGIALVGVGFFATLRSERREAAAASATPADELQELLASNSSDQKRIISLLPCESIALERTGCLGKCPIFRMSFEKGGGARLSALKHLPIEGE